MLTTTSFTTNTAVQNEMHMSVRRGSMTGYDGRHDIHANKSSRHPLHHGDNAHLRLLSSVPKNGEKVRINVSGRIFESYRSTLTSKKGSIFHLRNVVKYYDKENKEYFFNKDPRAFEAILVYLQCGILVRPETVALKNFVEELQFYGFDDKAWALYENEDVISPQTNHRKPRSEIGTAQYIYNMMEHPDVNIMSQIFVGFSCLVIFLSIIVYCLETLPSMEKHKHSLFLLEAVCVAWFTFELVTRFILTPEKFAFVKSFMNIIDLVSILPFYMDLIPKEDGGDYIGIEIFRVLRVARVFRIFKLSRYSKAIFLLIVTVKASIRELLLLLMFIVIVMVLFAAAIYHFENDLLDPKNKFRSIPHTFWVVIVTITTVGYGDMVPVTLGKAFFEFSSHMRGIGLCI